jgi:hypothetical protein
VIEDIPIDTPTLVMVVLDVWIMVTVILWMIWRHRRENRKMFEAVRDALREISDMVKHPGVFVNYPTAGEDVIVDEESIKEEIEAYMDGTKRYMAFTGMSVEPILEAIPVAPVPISSGKWMWCCSYAAITGHKNLPGHYLPHEVFSKLVLGDFFPGDGLDAPCRVYRSKTAAEGDLAIVLDGDLEDDR